MIELKEEAKSDALWYIAGFIDGEGHISIRKGWSGYSTMLGITNTNLHVLEII